MKKLIPLILKYAIAFSIAAFFIWLSLRGITEHDKHDIMQAMLRARLVLLLPVFALMLLSHYLRALRWKQLIEPMGYKPPAFDLLCGVLVGYLANQFIPRAGEIARCTVIGEQQKIPVEKLIGTILAERAFDLLCLLLLTVSVFFLQHNYLSGLASNIINKLATNLHEGGFKIWMLIILLAALLITSVLYFIKKAGTKTKLFVGRILGGLTEGFNSIRKLKHKWAFIIYTVLIWNCYILSTWMGCFAIAETAHLHITAGIVLLVSGTFGIIVAPGGLGAYPWAIQQTMLLYHINENIGRASGWLLMLAQVAFVLIFGSLAYFAARRRNRYYEKHGIGSK